LAFVLHHAPAKAYAGRNILHLAGKRRGSLTDRMPLQIDG